MFAQMHKSKLLLIFGSSYDENGGKDSDWSIGIQNQSHHEEKLTTSETGGN